MAGRLMLAWQSKSIDAGWIEHTISQQNQSYRTHLLIALNEGPCLLTMLEETGFENYLQLFFCQFYSKILFIH
jgi:hypothetical protein